MPKFKKVIRKQGGGGADYGAAARNQANYILGKREDGGGELSSAGFARQGIGGKPIEIGSRRKPRMSGFNLADSSVYKALGVPYMDPKLAPQDKPAASPTPGPAGGKGTSKSAPISAIDPAISGPVEEENEYLQEMMKSAGASQQPTVDSSFTGVNQDAMINALMSGAMGRRKSDLSDISSKAPGTSSELAKAAGEIPKTKAGMKKFMQDYGKFIALGAMAGAGGKGGQIAAPIIAALPGLIEMMKGRGKKKGGKGFAGYSEYDAMTKAHGGSMAKKSSGGDTPKKSEGGAIRKFKGGSMNTKDSMLTPKYKKGGDMPKAKMGKAVGEMPQHKKMAMGKPTPQSTGQKFAKGGAAKYAGGGMCKGYGISKKIRPTGPMN